MQNDEITHGQALQNEIRPINMGVLNICLDMPNARPHDDYYINLLRAI